MASIWKRHGDLNKPNHYEHFFRSSETLHKQGWATPKAKTETVTLATRPHWIAPTLAVLADTKEQLSQAKVIAARLNLPLANTERMPAALLLTVTATRLELRSTDPKEGGAVYVDFVAGKSAFRRQHGGGLRQPLARAVGLRGNDALSILDATPGLGQDAFVLASLGGQVQMVERSPIVATLLADGLQRMTAHTQQTGTVYGKMALIQADTREILYNLHATDGATQKNIKHPDVIYLDPMYPHRNHSALVKKEMRRLRTLVGDDNDVPELLASALLCAKKRVVVKRPRLAPSVSGIPPTMAIQSKNTRFDIYLVQTRA